MCGSPEEQPRSQRVAGFPRAQAKPPPRTDRDGGLCLSRKPKIQTLLRTHARLVARVMRAEIEEPPTVVPFQRNLPPCQRHLRIGIERTDVRPSRWRILLRIAQSGVVRV